jgi:hypothetical protein
MEMKNIAKSIIESTVAYIMSMSAVIAKIAVALMQTIKK